MVVVNDFGHSWMDIVVDHVIGPYYLICGFVSCMDEGRSRGRIPSNRSFRPIKRAAAGEFVWKIHCSLFKDKLDVLNLDTCRYIEW